MSTTDNSSELLTALERLAVLAPSLQAIELDKLDQQAPALAARLRHILQRDEQAEAWLQQLEQGIGRGLAAELDNAWAPGRIVGPYRLQRLLATGGMGAVFVARKADGELKRPVALKLVPPGLIDADALARFRRERDLLAALAHPHIAQLLDAGISEEGQPWFAMEYIDGQDMLQWCRQQAADAEQCISMMLQLVDAVRFAHRNLIVHGDLKPANVRIDAHGRLRLLDFGIARLMGELAADADKPETAHGYTPGFAAPELLAGQRATVASDIYALGVLLQQLLAAAAPRSKRRSRRELRLIAEQASHPDAAERYDSAGHFAAELRRWQQQEPVEAYHGGALYRFRKRLLRHPLGSAGLACALTAVIAFGVYSRYQAERYAAQRDSAQQLAGFMEQVFLGADPELARDKQLPARELLDRGLAQLENDLAGEQKAADVQARFAAIMGRTYQRLGDYATAQRLLNEALASRALDSTQRHEVLLELADNHYLSGRFAAAEAAYREQLPELVESTERARALAGLGRTLAQTGQTQEAIELLDASIALTRADGSVPPWRLAQRLNDAGSARFRLGDYQQAVSLLQQALTIRRELDIAAEQPLSPATATLLNNIGLMHYLNGQSQMARTALTESLALRRQVLSDDHPDLAQTLTNLGLLEKDYGDMQKAQALLAEALAVRKQALAPDHYRIGQAMLNLAIVLRELDQSDRAEPMFTAAIERLSAHLGAEHAQLAVVHTELGELYLQTGRLAQAESSFRRSLAIRRAALPAGHPHLGWSLDGLGRTLLASDKHAEAEVLLREAVDIRQRSLPVDDPLRKSSEQALAAAATNQR